MARSKDAYAREVRDRIFGHCVLVTHTKDETVALTAALKVRPGASARHLELAESGHYRCTPSIWSFNYNKVVPGPGASPGFIFKIVEAA